MVDMLQKAELIENGGQKLVKVSSLLSISDLISIKSDKKAQVIGMEDVNHNFKGFYSLESDIRSDFKPIILDGQILRRDIATGG